MNQLLSISPLLFGVVIGFAVPLLIIVKCERTYRLVNQNRKMYVFKASVALAVWGGLSLLLLIFLSGYMMGLAHTPHPGTTSDFSLIFTFWVMELIYGGVGWLLVVWMKRREEVQGLNASNHGQHNKSLDQSAGSVFRNLSDRIDG